MSATRSVTRRSVTLAVALALQPALHAQSDDAGLQEIVVTAQKREQRLVDVPIAITALSGDALDRRGITDVQGLEGFTPNLQISPTPGNSTSAQIAIRGRVTSNPALTWEPAVGIYVDGVYIGKTQGALFDLIEIDRIEVLRGPQGTLWGRNALAGAFNIVTRSPSGEASGSATMSLGNFSALGGKVSIDFPKIGETKVNLAVASQRRDGWVDNRVGNLPTPPGRAASTSELNNINSKSVRLAVDAPVNESFKIAYRGDYNDINQNASHSQLYRTLLPFLAPYVSTSRQEKATVDGPSFERSETQGHSLTLEWQLNDSNTLRSITAKRKLTWEDGLDLDGSPLNIAHTQRLSDYDSVSQEMQWIGNTGALSYVAGLYYFKDDGFTDNPQAFFVEFGPRGVRFKSQYGFETRALAAFGQVDYAINDQFAATAGVRYTDEDKSIARCAGLVGVFDYVPCITRAKTSFSDVTPLAVLTWRPSDSFAAYAKYAEGFKSGGFNGEAGDPANPIPVNVAQVQTPYLPESLESIEVGGKWLFAGNRGYANIAIFNNDSQDIQLSIFEAKGAANSTVKNAGEANVKGLEVELGYQFPQGTQLQFALGKMDGEFDRYLDRGVDVAFNRALVHSPETTISATVDAALGRILGAEVRLLLDASYIDDYLLYAYPVKVLPATDPSSVNSALANDTRVPSYTLVNARLSFDGVEVGGAQVDVALWSKNLMDKKYIQNMIDFGPGFGSLTQVYYGTPRTYGIELTGRW
ncbi:MAG: TonB-dependent receptor [Gammaproteobacteria bacterium]|nr:TonB-dependent receptor [Gammaproteobacteria bacterium]